MDINTGHDYVSLCDPKVQINMCPIYNGYKVMVTWVLIAVDMDCWKQMGQSSKQAYW